MLSFVQSGLAQTAKVTQEQVTFESNAAGGEDAVKLQQAAALDANHPNKWDNIGDPTKATWFNGVTVFGVYESYEASVVPIAG